MSSSYDVVNESAYFKDWYDGLLELPPDAELEQDQSLIQLRKSSAKLIKNNFMAASSQLAYVNTILGGKIKLGVADTNKSFEEEVQRVLDANTVGMDINRQYSLSQIAEQIITGSFDGGDILINLPRDSRYKGKIKTYIELIEASRIKTPPKHRDNHLVREGVHYHESGRLKGYWVIKNTKLNDKYVTYYTAQDDDFKFFPAYKSDGELTRKVCTLFKSPLNLRPGQSRGIPVLTPVMGLLRYFSQYLEAVLIGSRVAACFSAFVTSANPAEAIKSMSGSGEDSIVTTAGKKLVKLQPGTISYLKMNESITFASPNKPSDNFDTFVLRLAKFVAMTLRIPYEQIFLDLSQTNYSSWRGGSLETSRNINRWKRDLDSTLRWILFTFLQEALVTRELKGSLKGMTLKITFPVYKTVDEEKTARADRLNLQSESTSQQRIQAGMGESLEELQDEQEKEALRKVETEGKVLIEKKKLSEEYGIIFDGQAEKDKESRDTSGSRRKGEEGGEDLDKEDADERRKTDGNR